VLVLLETTVKQGARWKPACDCLGLHVRTVERWKRQSTLKDQRQYRTFKPANALTQAEREAVLEIANQEKYSDLAPSQIVPTLADEGRYIASESTFYRILKAQGQLTHRLKSQPREYHKPRELFASGPNQVWSWDISYCVPGVQH